MALARFHRRRDRETLMVARPLHKADVEARQAERIVRLENALREQRRLRIEAEKNALRFHALMLQARVALITREARP